MTYVAANFSREHAERFFNRRRFGNLWGLLRRGPRGNRAPHIELVWMPHYLVEVNVTSRNGPGVIPVSVEAHSGAFALCDALDGLREGDPADDVAGECLSPALDEEAARALALKELRETIMRRRSQEHKPLIQDIRGVSLFQYPYWLEHYERWRGKLDIHVFDAVSGTAGGAMTKTGILSALIQASRRKRAASSG